MWMVRHIVCRGTLALPVLFAVLAPLHAQTDPVEDLRQALHAEDVRKPNEQILAFRRKTLDDKIRALKTIGELRRALPLEDWKEYPGQGRSEELRLIDEEKRKEVGKRLLEAVHKVVVSGDPLNRLAVANLISEMGPDVRSLSFLDNAGFARLFTDDVIQLVHDPDWGVRQEALRALSTINAEPKKAVPVFRKILEQDAKVEARRLAALGLGQLMRVVNQLKKRIGPAHRVFAGKQDVLAMAEMIVLALDLALADPDPVVQGFALDALQETAQSIAFLVPEPMSRKAFPAEGRPLTEEERADIVRNYEKARDDLKDFQTISQLWKNTAPALVPLLAAENPHVRLAAVSSLENLAWTRRKIKRVIESVPLTSTEKNKTTPIAIEDPLRDFFPKGLPAVAKLLADPETRVRRTALEFVENIPDRAASLIPILAHRLADSDLFVRWSAARILGNIAPAQAQLAVPQLARLLLDADLNVRLAAASTLQAMGPLAVPALPAMTAALLDGDVDARLAVMDTLLALPHEHAKEAVPALTELLANLDPRLRKQAAHTLGRLGRSAGAALPALRRLLGDDDPTVRAAASEAILSIALP